jgi:hypothetical protein
MATIPKVMNKKPLLEGYNTIPYKQSSVKNIISNIKRISKESTKNLTMGSAIKAVLVFAGTIGLYNLFKNTSIFSYFGLGKNSKNKDISEIVDIKKKENALTERRGLKTANQVNDPLINQITQNYRPVDKTVKFEGKKVEEFKDLSKGKKNAGMRRTFDRRSINVQNPIEDQNAIVGKPFNFYF